MFTPEQPAVSNSYTSKNAQKIFDRIGGGLNQDKNNQTRDEAGNVGKVDYDK